MVLLGICLGRDMEKKRVADKKYYLKNRNRIMAYNRKRRSEGYYKKSELEFKLRLHTDPEVKSRVRANYMRYSMRLKERVFRHYSPELRCMNPNCEVVGGARDIHALSIDHINGGGCQHRRQLGYINFYKWLEKNGYPEGFRVLCMSCQYIKKSENKEVGNRFI
jgi:hypothetical protein